MVLCGDFKRGVQDAKLLARAMNLRLANESENANLVTRSQLRRNVILNSRLDYFMIKGKVFHESIQGKIVDSDHFPLELNFSPQTKDVKTRRLVRQNKIAANCSEQ